METILIVDDNQEISSFLAGTVLPSLGYETVVAYHGAQALEIIKQHHAYIQLVLVDLNLPDMTGLDVLRGIRDMNIRLPAILITAHGSEQVAVDAFRLGVEDYLTKPVEVEQLSIAMQRALGDLRMRREAERLTAQLKEQINWLTVLSRVGKSITATLDTDHVLRRIVEAGVLLTHAEEGFIALVDQPSGQLYVRAAKSFEDNTAKTLRTPISDSFATDVLRNRKPLREPMSPTKVDGRQLKVSTGMLVRSVLYIPLQAKDNPLGVLSVHNRRSEKIFSSSDETMMLSLADYASVALDNAMLYDRAQQEISERRRVEDQLRYDNMHDRLTGLMNRVAMLGRINLSLERLERQPKQSFAVLFLDIDRFKDVNDSLGHLLGDQLIIATGQMLNHIVRPTDAVARLGGDEFVVLLEGITDMRDAVRVADRIQEELSETELLPGHNLFVSASIGIVQALDARGNQLYSNPEDLLRDADIAMYRAKSQGRARYEIFDTAMRDSILRRMNLETDLRRAMAAQELVVYYQPVLGVSDGKLLGFEALVRWRHPERGLLLPGEFIQVAEETGLIIQIDRWVMREACRQVRDWQLSINGQETLRMSINLSGKQIAQPDLVSFISRVIEETGVPPELINLEITETTVMENHVRTVEILNALREVGVQIQVDDFGVGYSSLSYLSQFPLDALKIDKSFVSTMHQDETNMRIVQAIVMMTHGLGIKVVAEGVETAAQLKNLHEMGCEFVQGYLIAVPMDKDQARRLLNKQAKVKNRLIPPAEPSP
jgi:diguanylate cyclase (GGDEF)-like protein